MMHRFKKRKQPKKAQMEIMGLAIIVVLVLVGLLFVVRFVVNEPRSEVKKSYFHSEVASNLLAAMLKTTVEECNGNSVAELFQDCALGSTIECADGKKSCDKAEEITAYLLEHTLGAWNKQYSFSVISSRTGANLFSSRIPNPSSPNACPSSVKEKQAKLYPIPLNPGTLLIKLEICE